MSGKVLKVGLYWRKSKYFGGLCPPGVFTLTNERISFTTEEGTLFDVRLSDARASLSGFGTLTVYSADQSWDLLATAGQESRTFTRAQQRELGAAGAKKPDVAAGTKPVRDLAAVLSARGMSVDIRKNINLYVLYGAIGLAVATLIAVLLLSR
jgi:hypothetical protein